MSYKTLFLVLLAALLLAILIKFVFNNENARLAFSNGGFQPVNESNFVSEEGNKKELERTIIDKINDFEIEMVKTSNPGRKFEIKQELKELKAKLDELRS